MTIKITKNHVKTSNKKKRPSIKMKATSITIHSTANAASTAKNERAWLDNPSNTNTASWHYVIDEKDCIEAIPASEVAWHAGDPTGNNSSIGIEICESGNRKKTLERAEQLTADLMKKHNIKKVVRHYDWTKKNCPRILSANSWKEWKLFHSNVMKKFNTVTSENKLLEVITPSLWTYNTADWDDRAVIVEKGEVFTVVKDKFKVENGYMYKLKSGLYISANTKYVKIRK